MPLEPPVISTTLFSKLQLILFSPSAFIVCKTKKNFHNKKQKKHALL
jgi:hypothetical protein